MRVKDKMSRNPRALLRTITLPVHQVLESTRNGPTKWGANLRFSTRKGTLGHHVLSSNHVLEKLSHTLDQRPPTTGPQPGTGPRIILYRAAKSE